MRTAVIAKGPVSSCIYQHLFHVVMKIFLRNPNIYLINQWSLSPVCGIYHYLYITADILICLKNVKFGLHLIQGPDSFNSFTTFIQSLTHCNQICSVCCIEMKCVELTISSILPSQSPCEQHHFHSLFSYDCIPVSVLTKGQLILLGECLQMKKDYH